MPTASERLVVFAKAPRLGKVKTRLCPPFTPEQALALHGALIEDTLERLAGFTRPGLERWLYLSENIETLGDLTIPSVWTLETQTGEDLGARLRCAFVEAFQQRIESMVVVGTDSPTVPLSCIHDAFEDLKRLDVVIGPARDGGYYLLGASRLVPELFENIPWGHVTVLQHTVAALRAAGRRFTSLIEWYDIDREEDLVRLREEAAFLERETPLDLPTRTLAVLPDDAGI